MAEYCNIDSTESRTSADDEATPPRLRLPLRTAENVRSELAKVYRLARSERLPVADASRLANILQILARLIEVSVLEQRIEALETAQKAQEGHRYG